MSTDLALLILSAMLGGTFSLSLLAEAARSDAVRRVAGIIYAPWCALTLVAILWVLFATSLRP